MFLPCLINQRRPRRNANVGGQLYMSSRRRRLFLADLAQLAVRPVPLPGNDLYERLQSRNDMIRLAGALRAEAARIEREIVAQGPIPLPEPGRDFAVTDHALVRFLERCMGWNIEAVRTQIARLIPSERLPVPDLREADKHGALCIDGFWFLLSPVAVISVLGRGMTPERWLEKGAST